MTTKEAGSIGGQMVKDVCPERTLSFTREYRWVEGHSKRFTYRVVLRA